MSRAPRTAVNASPRVLVLAGWEPAGEVGVRVDMRAIEAAGGEPLPAVTTLTAQGEGRFRAVPVPPAMLRAQVAMHRERGGWAAIKVGVLPDAGALRVLRAVLEDAEKKPGRGRDRGMDCVVDPVVRSSGGGRLSSLQRESFLDLAHLRVVLTPNALEAGWLLARTPPRTAAEAEHAARDLLALGFGGVVVKGGHLVGKVVDVVAWNERARSGARALHLSRPRREQRTLRGTGCRFASFLAARMAAGEPLGTAARQAHAYLGRCFG